MGWMPPIFRHIWANFVSARTGGFSLPGYSTGFCATALPPQPLLTKILLGQVPWKHLDSHILKSMELLLQILQQIEAEILPSTIRLFIVLPLQVNL
jgi:hypothetical protein